MEGLQLVVVIGAAILVGGIVSSRLRVPAPLVLLLLGAAIGFIPSLYSTVLPPELVLLLFLPALLFWESLNTSLREIRRNLRVILLLSIVLVFVTAAVVAFVGHAFGLPWPVALALGAILAPTDATAVSAVAGRMPRRQLTIIRAESLINDGTALVLYAIAVNAAVSGTEIPLGDATLRFITSYAGALVIGLAVGFAVIGIRRLVPERLLVNALTVLTPFLAYLPAEALGVSGVVAVVTCGLLLTQIGAPFITASMRVQSAGFWQLSTYILNGALFVLIGFELHRVAALLENGLITITVGIIVAIAVVATRLGWSSITPVFLRLFDRRPTRPSARVAIRHRFPSAWAGFRGAVSLAAALALPMETINGDPLPGRAEVIAITFIVILFTLLVQGLSMEAIVRWSRLPEDPTEFDEELLAEQAALQAVLDELPAAAERLGTSDSTAETLRGIYRERLDRIHREDGSPAEARREESEADRASELELALVPVQRAAVIRLRDSGRIDDVVLRRVQARIDLEELRLSDAVED